LLALFHDQVRAHRQVRPRAALYRAQAALVELVCHRLANTLLGEVTLDPRVIRAVLQARLLPRPTAVGGKITAGIEILLHVIAGAGGKQ
jgi:hypothetical protein